MWWLAPVIRDPEPVLVFQKLYSGPRRSRQIRLKRRGVKTVALESMGIDLGPSFMRSLRSAASRSGWSMPGTFKNVPGRAKHRRASIASGLGEELRQLRFRSVDHFGPDQQILNASQFDVAG